MWMRSTCQIDETRDRAYGPSLVPQVLLSHPLDDLRQLARALLIQEITEFKEGGSVLLNHRVTRLC